MTIKTLTVSMLLATSILLLTGCGDNDTSEAVTGQNPILQTNTNTGETSDGEGSTDNGDTTIGTGGTVTHTETNTGISGDDEGTTSSGDADENTSIGGSSKNDDNTSTGDGSDDSNSTIGGGNDNTTTSPTVALVSLKLIVDKTSLNKDENTTVKVMATYSDNTSKEVTDNVEWVVIPSDAVKMTSTTLTALQDKATTVKAKLNTVTSDAVSLNITWIVNGHTLPPEPDKATNDSTLLGIDVNDNGVRDDVERWIYERYKDEHPIMIPLKMQLSRAHQKIIVDTSKARETDKFMVDADNCAWAFTSLSANYFGRKPLVLKDSETDIKEMKEMDYIQFNTTQRARAYGLYNQTLSGGVYDSGWESDSWIENCDFDTPPSLSISYPFPFPLYF